MNIQEVDINQAKERLDAGDALFVDVRDGMSFRQARIPGALHVTDQNVQDFVDDTDKSKPVVVYCYHGNNSRGGAAYFQSMGFEEVYSMAGGFEAWRGAHPFDEGAPS